ncbi:MAG: radical SAM protein [Elusimicrobiales bacterium]|nr:radical SAM protein [Elusimicrobiales bacterium]
MPDIAFWNKCNNKCVMCTNEGGFSLNDSALYGLRPQVEKLERWLKGRGKVYLKNDDKKDFVSLTGGEPTIHPDFFRLLAYFRRRLPGAGITLLSNGRRFADKEFTGRFLKVAAPPFAVAVPVHAPTPALHDKIAGVRGAFGQTLAGLENLLAGAGPLEVQVRLVLHRLNIKKLGPLLSFLLAKFPDTRRYSVTAIHYEIEGMSLANHRRLALRLKESAAALGSALPLIKRFHNFRLYHFPRCLVRPELRRLCWVTLPPEDRVYTAKCRGCRARRGCLGLMGEYYKAFGDGELRRL